MTDTFESSRYSVAHAKRRLGELHAGTKERHKIVLATPLPLPLRGIAFDVLSNLRAALDQAGYAVAVAAGASGKAAKFPFGETRADVEKRRKGGSKQLPNEIFDVAVALQPYRGGNDLLWALNKLCNSNKHEILIPMGVAIAHASGSFSFRGDVESLTFPPRWDSAKNEMVLGVVSRGSKLGYDLDFRAFVSLSQLQEVEGREAVAILSAMTGIVERSLVALEGEARRIGLIR